ncbi:MULTISPECIES: ParB/RepB/Spo0J family partition protein [unclassified Nocardiopsis]|uniref:ParB/RepB/Spo0J family partition protein n=1 Tax=unclassified Nocardiopsis TaxID=2649073 RepID=UPI00135B1884|nr:MULTISPECIES: ParB/RepB/Spo0J family partition protein [unclassified Nocardiopsis]
MLAEQKYELVPVEALEPHPDNPRKGDTEAIAESIEENGFFGAVLAQKSRKRILAGEHRWKAAKAHGEKKVPVIWIDVDDDRARKILLADNRTQDLATYDEAAVLAILDDLGADASALSGTGWSMDAYEDLLARNGQVVTSPPAKTEPTYAETPAEEEERISNLGTRNKVASGLRELVLVMPLGAHTRAMERFAELRKDLGAEMTGGEIALGALLAVEPSQIEDALTQFDAESAQAAA